MDRRNAAIVVLALLGACADEPGTGEQVPGAGQAARSEPESSGAGAMRSQDPRAQALREALEEGALDRAEVLLDQVGQRLGSEGPCTRARILALRGDVLGALRALEEARRVWPGDPGPAATTVEIYATTGSLEAATDEYNRAVTVFGRGPELMRAQGVLAVVTPGAAESAVSMLEEALRADPDLPYVEEPLATARWLAGRMALSRGDVDRAEALARAALALRPSDPDARITLADALKGRGDFEGALPWLEALHAEGVAVADELAQLHHAAATKAMLAGDRPRQVDHYLAARRFGYDDERLGHGALVLAREADGALEQGLEAEREAAGAPDEARAGLLDRAEQAYRQALVFAPGSVEAGHRLAKVLFDQGRPREAALAWEAAAARARVDPGAAVASIPLELNAAIAWEQAGRADLASERVRDYLDREPGGPYRDAALALIERLEAEREP
jgi:Tfp pilus assembly protein PilF